MRSVLDFHRDQIVTQQGIACSGTAIHNHAWGVPARDLIQIGQVKKPDAKNSSRITQIRLGRQLPGGEFLLRSLEHTHRIAGSSDLIGETRQEEHIEVVAEKRVLRQNSDVSLAFLTSLGMSSVNKVLRCLKNRFSCLRRNSFLAVEYL